MKKIALLVAVLTFQAFAMAADQVPYKATLASTSVELVFPMPGVDTGRCAQLDLFIPLPSQTGLRWGLMKITAVGRSTHMGLVTDVQSHCTPLPVDPLHATPPPIGGDPIPFLLGEATLTAANGDTIHGTYSGLMRVTEAGMIVDGILITDSGTGRFAGATGTGRAFGVQGFDGSSALTITGTISSPGSLKQKN